MRRSRKLRVKRAPSPRPVGESHPAGIRRAFAVVLVLLGMGVLPYQIPSLAQWQVVTAEEPLPFSNILEFRSLRQTALGGAADVEPGPMSDEELLAAALPTSPRARVGTDVSAPGGEISEGDLPPGQRILQALSEETEELVVDIEDPHGVMNHFYRQWVQVSEREPGTLARISVYGTSTNGADRATRSLRHALASRFGDGGKGWVPIAPGWRYQNHQDVEWEHHGWRTSVVNRGEESHGRYGYGGVLARNRAASSSASFGTSEEGPANNEVSRFRLFYHASPEGGVATVQVDDGEPASISTAGAAEDRAHTVEMPRGGHQIRVGVESGDLELYGVVMENEGPGMVVDGLALIGAFTRVMLHFDEDHIRRQIALRAPDLQIFWLGANDAVSSQVPFRRTEYVENYTQILSRARSGRREASCMVMSIMDKGERVDGRFIRTHRRVPRVVEAQRESAMNAGCAFFNIYEAMGGEGTMRRWWRSDPRLVSGDLGHLTGYGSRVVGQIMYLALLRGASEYIRNGQP